MVKQKVTSTFRFLCLAVTGCLILFCAWKYVENKSTSLVDFKRFHMTEKDIYPSISLCFDGMYDQTTLRDKYGIDNVEEYIKFLKGEVWHDFMLGVNYDKVTMNLNDFVQEITLHSGEAFTEPFYTFERTNTTSENRRKRSLPFFVSFRQALTKCFTLDVEEKINAGTGQNFVTAMYLRFQNISSLNTNLTYLLHYPGQINRAFLLDYEIKNSSGIMSGNMASKIFLIGTLEIIRRRNTRKQPCNMNSYNDDLQIHTKFVETNSCKPPHWIGISYPRICNTSKKMRDAYFGDREVNNPDFLDKFMKPCDQVQTLSLNFQESQLDNWETFDSKAFLGFAFRSLEFKEILHIQAFDLEGLVGNMGGYIGLFLGFAFWNIPDAFMAMINYLMYSSK